INESKEKTVDLVIVHCRDLLHLRYSLSITQNDWSSAAAVAVVNGRRLYVWWFVIGQFVSTDGHIVDNPNTTIALELPLYTITFLVEDKISVCLNEQECMYKGGQQIDVWQNDDVDVQREPCNNSNNKKVLDSMKFIYTKNYICRPPNENTDSY
ncbi:hypothetical protein BLOT_002940, partial [Blomia tropicalis]